MPTLAFNIEIGEKGLFQFGILNSAYRLNMLLSRLKIQMRHGHRTYLSIIYRMIAARTQLWKNEVFVDPKIFLKPFKNDYFGPRGCQKIEFFIISGSIWTYSQPSTSRFCIVPWRIWRFCFVSSLFEQGAGLGIKFWGLQFQNLFCTVYDRTWCTFWRLAF